MKSFTKYIKGEPSTNNVQQEIEINAETEEQSSTDKMFSKDYWFGDSNKEEPINDPWLPQMVIF